MPRRNENADYYRPGHQYKGRIYPLYLLSSEAPIKTPKPKAPRAGTMRTTAEQIVHDFRRSEGLNMREPVGMIRAARRPFFLKRWFRAIDWDNLLQWGDGVLKRACIGALIGCLIYLGIFVFGPFTVKLIR